jgi:hypothetical protein
MQAVEILMKQRNATSTIFSLKKVTSIFCLLTLYLHF